MIKAIGKSKYLKNFYNKIKLNYNNKSEKDKMRPCKNKKTLTNSFKSFKTRRTNGGIIKIKR
jgi:hypothetical protein